MPGDDIELESEEFNAAFQVFGDQPRFAYDVLHPRMMRFLLDRGYQSIRMDGTVLVVWPGRPHQTALGEPAVGAPRPLRVLGYAGRYVELEVMHRRNPDGRTVGQEVAACVVVAAGWPPFELVDGPGDLARSGVPAPGSRRCR